MTIEWSDEDQAGLARIMKRELADLLKDDSTRNAAFEEVSWLHLYVCAMREEIIAWAESGAGEVETTIAA